MSVHTHSVLQMFPAELPRILEAGLDRLPPSDKRCWWNWALEAAWDRVIRRNTKSCSLVAGVVPDIGPGSRIGVAIHLSNPRLVSRLLCVHIPAQLPGIRIRSHILRYGDPLVRHSPKVLSMHESKSAHLTSSLLMHTIFLCLQISQNTHHTRLTFVYRKWPITYPHQESLGHLCPAWIYKPCGSHWEDFGSLYIGSHCLAAHCHSTLALDISR